MTDKILIIDDEDIILRGNSLILKSLGYDVVTAKNGNQAISMYKQYQDSVTLLLLDLSLPDIQGIEVLEKIRTVNPDIKAILTSGYLEDDNISQITKNDTVEFIQKPFSIDQLKEKLSILL